MLDIVIKYNKKYMIFMLIIILYIALYSITGCGIIKSIHNYLSQNKLNPNSTSMDILSASKLVNDYPKSGRAHFMLGVAYYHKHKYSKAIEELKISESLQKMKLACIILVIHTNQLKIMIMQLKHLKCLLIFTNKILVLPMKN